MDIEGGYTTDDLTVTAGFQGPASDPELVLTSNPSLPEDEILSQVLFGKSQGSLSAIEAVQLASAVNELSGGGGGLDIVGSVRRFIGADVLQVGGGEDGPNVKVGKYLTDGVYVGTKTGTTPGSSGVEVAKYQRDQRNHRNRQQSRCSVPAGLLIKFDVADINQRPAP